MVDLIHRFLERCPRRVLWLGCALAAAVLAAVLRVVQLATAFEEPLGLAVPHAPASVSLTCVLVIAGAALAILAATQPLCRRPWTQGQAHRWDFAFLDAGDKVYPVLLVGAGFLALGAAPALFVKGFRQMEQFLSMRGLQDQPTDNGLLMLITAGCALLAFFGLLQMGRESFQPGRRGKGGFSATLPAVAGCAWLMEHFRTHASNPVLWDYAPELLAIVCGMLFYLDSAGMSTGAARPRRLLWLAGMTVVLSAVSLAGRPALADALLLAAQLLAAAAALWRLPVNLEHPPAVGRPYPHADPDQTEAQQEEESTHE